ncbi:hypothetical protein JXJ21_07615 [candidate division KSB1 bacterium]|nr:hypothetical protein [candidate division KSB1 bacterium]
MSIFDEVANKSRFSALHTYIAIGASLILLIIAFWLLDPLGNTKEQFIRFVPISVLLLIPIAMGVIIGLMVRKIKQLNFMLQNEFSFEFNVLWDRFNNIYCPNCKSQLIMKWYKNQYAYCFHCLNCKADVNILSENGQLLHFGKLKQYRRDPTAENKIKLLSSMKPIRSDSSANDIL